MTRTPAALLLHRTGGEAERGQRTQRRGCLGDEDGGKPWQQSFTDNRLLSIQTPLPPNLALKGSACERTLCDPDAELSWQGFYRETAAKWETSP